MFAARIAKDAGILWGRLLCGKPTGCRGRLGEFSRDYAATTVPPEFMEIMTYYDKSLTEEDIKVADEDDRRRDVLHIWTWAYIQTGWQTVNGSRLPFLALPAARKRWLTTAMGGRAWYSVSRLAIEEHRDTVMRAGKDRKQTWQDNVVVRCGHCGFPNLVSRSDIDTELVRRYQSWPAVVCVVRHYRWVEVYQPVSHPDALIGREIHGTDYYGLRLKGDPDAAWCEWGTRYYPSGLMPPIDAEGMPYRPAAIPRWAACAWDERPRRDLPLPPSAVSDGQAYWRWRDAMRVRRVP